MHDCMDMFVAASNIWTVCVIVLGVHLWSRFKENITRTESNFPLIKNLKHTMASFTHAMRSGSVIPCLSTVRTIW